MEKPRLIQSTHEYKYEGYTFILSNGTSNFIKVFDDSDSGCEVYSSYNNNEYYSDKIINLVKKFKKCLNL